MSPRPQGRSRDKDVVTASKQISAGGAPSERQAIGMLPETTKQDEDPDFGMEFALQTSFSKRQK